jgi:hypothetical protein
MYKVFIQNKPLEVIDVNDSYTLEENCLVLKHINESELEDTLSLLEKIPTLSKLILLAENPQEAFEAVKKNSK